MIHGVLFLSLFLLINQSKIHVHAHQNIISWFKAVECLEVCFLLNWIVNVGVQTDAHIEYVVSFTHTSGSLVSSMLTHVLTAVNPSLICVCVRVCVCGADDVLVVFNLC